MTFKQHFEPYSMTFMDYWGIKLYFWQWYENLTVYALVVFIVLILFKDIQPYMILELFCITKICFHCVNDLGLVYCCKEMELICNHLMQRGFHLIKIWYQ